MTTLMTTTLPTVIGMGVVSETTKTLFGKGKRSRRRDQGSTGQVRSNSIMIGNRTYKLRTGNRGGRYYVHKSRKIYV